MTAPAAPAAPTVPAEVPSAVRTVLLDADGVEVSGLLAEPEGVEPRAVVVAIHGRGMCADYFNGLTDPADSLLTLGAGLGYSVLALDRPGYGASVRQLPEGQPLGDQATTLHAALTDFAKNHPTGAGFFVVAHSDGGKVSLHMAAQDAGRALLGLDINGCGWRYAREARHFPDTLGGGASRLNWGPLNLYAPGTFRASRSLLRAVPRREEIQTAVWPIQYPRLAGHITNPLRLTFAEHELWWELDDASLASMKGRLTAAPLVTVERLPAAGHNISIGRAARTYHLRALAFLEECLLLGRGGAARG
ncbi:MULTISPECIES: alpha/beta hydrolase [unclassified Streptomyces]|uniref:alpha/beta hydrolase n=1 Tax=unclassified Streptomyces TaxID=2593676 RepID=UPI00081D90B5|nr:MULTISPECIES: alpha/beta hydrolase [unclassified Streptomyces]MYZ37038.1 alpha/beta fold hydrolase [Streptomyces sp. SID4917]SCF88157.1 Alpha/beta hydrolase family protein [Streptomyces sp. MnatMP-M17]